PPELRRKAAAELAEAVAGTVHEMMEPALAVLPAATTVSMAIDFLRAHATPQQITYMYVTGADDRLIGLVVIRDLLLAEPGDTLAEVMLPDPFAVPVDMDVGDAIKAALHRHYPVYPVVDGEQHIVGVIRGWRLFERQAVEISAQSGQMVGVDKEERLGTSFWAAFRMRHPWLQVNLLTAFLAGFVVSLFEGTITQIVALAAFLPILAGQSGNTGCQALAITLRGITLGDMDKFRVSNLVRKEMMLGAINGLLTGLVAGAAMWWSASRGGGDVEALRLGAVIVLAMIGACMMSGMFGVLVPLTLRRFGADPATASSIFLTTGTDIAGMGLMLFLATMLVL
ncbi:MAG: magnesium transporter, partial [Panacagrimonas sp.]